MKGNPRPIKIRKNWGNVKPVTKIKDSDKFYDRDREKDQFRKNKEDEWLRKQRESGE
jgi:hypothetical protein